MKFLLTLTVCSSLLGECMPPFKWKETFKTHYDCATFGYQEAAKKTAEIGRKDVNEYAIVISFSCTMVNTI